MFDLYTLGTITAAVLILIVGRSDLVDLVRRFRVRREIQRTADQRREQQLKAIAGWRSR